ncbi:Snf7-domain-containing protein [Rozella allomycis CSF55]|uniref:Snf7-domain-containing protein n=1 Tax=Rozella allomycis (strain CSF55) TaxID=988480 RepID=A0A075AQ81_ROZAC|nr:Snf7 domain-containing protein [Rozella allomycis CSF55]RKP21039.1 Snf7-domain-containing protein [Rozella allomycis CSF55]|eukprot:EPZ32305.1 Snf7 domain-containing protein [Rozella allomycis CSF55]
MMKTLFGSGPTLEEQVIQVKKWKQQLKTEERKLDRQIRNIESQEAKVKREIKTAAKQAGGQVVCRTLAKELVRSKRTRERLHTNKAQLSSLSMQLQQQVFAGVIQKSTVIMKLANNLIRLPEMQKTMMDMSKEMMKAEMMEETLGMDDEEIEEEAEEEVDKVLNELTQGIVAPATKLKSSDQQLVDEENMQQRLQDLRS